MCVGTNAHTHTNALATAVCPHLELLAAIDGADLLQEDPSAEVMTQVEGT